MQLTGAIVRWIVAATIHDARCVIDEPQVRGVSSAVDPGLKLVDVVIGGGASVLSCRSEVDLHRVQPAEEASDPLQLQRGARSQIEFGLAQKSIWANKASLPSSTARLPKW